MLWPLQVTAAAAACPLVAAAHLAVASAEELSVARFPSLEAAASSPAWLLARSNSPRSLVTLHLRQPHLMGAAFLRVGALFLQVKAALLLPLGVVFPLQAQSMKNLQRQLEVVSPLPVVVSPRLEVVSSPLEEASLHPQVALTLAALVQVALEGLELQGGPPALGLARLERTFLLQCNLG